MRNGRARRHVRLGRNVFHPIAPDIHPPQATSPHIQVVSHPGSVTKQRALWLQFARSRSDYHADAVAPSTHADLSLGCAAPDLLGHPNAEPVFFFPFLIWADELPH
jgi:hypothetical protein